MTKKKFIAITIQVTLLITIVCIGYFTYKAVEKDNLALETKVIEWGNAACPAFKKRACVEESYTTEPIKCKPMADECNSQNDLKFCFQYTWKQNRKVSYCRMCSGTNFDYYNDRTLVTCKTKENK